MVGRVRSKELVKIFGVELARVINDKSDEDPKEIVKQSIQKLKSEVLVQDEFFIPCILPNFKGIRRFKIGPVIFYEKNHFFETFDEELSIIDTKHIDHFKEQYKVQNWIASVLIKNFSNELAEERAYLCVRIVIASIKTKLDLSRSQWLGTRKQSMPDLSHYSFQRSLKSNAQNMHASFGRQFILNADNRSVEHLLTNSSRDWFWLVGTIINNISKEGQWEFLINKLVTAFIWLDLGNSPTSDAERVIAFSNCLESLFVTSTRNIKRQIVDRATLILIHSAPDDERNKKLEDFYEARCALVHGKKMPISSDFSKYAYLGKYLTDHCILGMVYFLEWLIKKHARDGTKQHEKPFNGPGSFTKALDKELKEFIDENQVRINVR